MNLKWQIEGKTNGKSREKMSVENRFKFNKNRGKIGERRKSLLTYYTTVYT